MLENRGVEDQSETYVNYQLTSNSIAQVPYQ